MEGMLRPLLGVGVLSPFPGGGTRLPPANCSDRFAILFGTTQRRDSCAESQFELH